MPELSIILPTCNRADLLDRCLNTIVRNTKCDFEIIVVDGASTDHSWHVLDQAKQELGERLQLIYEDSREGFVRAANKGFQIAKGRYLTWLNDDARPLPGAYANAIAQLHIGTPDIGLIAMFHRCHSRRNIAFEKFGPARPLVSCAPFKADPDRENVASDQYQLCHVRGTLYANFAVGRREVFEQLRFFDERFFLNGADPDLSLKAWHEGLSIVPAASSYIDHDEHGDARRSTDANKGKQDNASLFAKWDLPPANPKRNEFDPARPCTLRGLRDLTAVAA